MHLLFVFPGVFDFRTLDRSRPQLHAEAVFLSGGRACDGPVVVHLGPHFSSGYSLVPLFDALLDEAHEALAVTVVDSVTVGAAGFGLVLSAAVLQESTHLVVRCR